MFFNSISAFSTSRPDGDKPTTYAPIGIVSRDRYMAALKSIPPRRGSSWAH